MRIHPGRNIAWVPLALAKGCKRVSTSLCLFQVEGIGENRLAEEKGSKKTHAQQKS